MHRSGTLAQFTSLGAVGWIAAIVLTGNQIGFVVAIRSTSVANTLLILATVPMFAAGLGWLVAREAVPGRLKVAIVVSLMGVLFILGNSVSSGRMIGEMAALVTAILYALYIVLLRKADNDVMLPTLCLSALFAACLTWPFAAPLAVGRSDILILAFLSYLPLPTAFVLFFSGTRYIPAAEVGLLALLETVLGPVWAWLGLGEAPSSMSLVGGGLVVGAIATNAMLAMREAPNKEPVFAEVDTNSPIGPSF